LIKNNRGQHIHWNQEVKIPEEINNLRRDTNFFNRKATKRRSDIWYYTKVKNEKIHQLNLNRIEVTIPWDDASNNPEKLQREIDQRYILTSF
jgi:hypothetical protein